MESLVEMWYRSFCMRYNDASFVYIPQVAEPQRERYNPDGSKGETDIAPQLQTDLSSVDASWGLEVRLRNASESDVVVQPVKEGRMSEVNGLVGERVAMVINGG
ncbi:hypothetical protein E2C01_056273 [Portunus trituberculatus]|uniref:Uncharacterized protein n=1 Tax=Portunus trituberculatus TaxID=210409 RepID=A0A5B7GPZ2_PORTR|nr:hypothetical protein [Portunus trituberculatus]